MTDESQTTIARRDVHVHSDLIHGDKVDGDKVSGDYIRVTIGDNAQNVIVGKDNQIIINSSGIAPLYVNVPAMPNNFLGREELIDSLTKQLISQNHLALSTEGLPGVGKTTLAVAIAHRVEVVQHFSDGVLWAGLGQQADVSSSLASWAEVLGVDVSNQKTASQRSQVIKTAIGQRKFLIIIDDAWSIEDACYLRCGGPNCCHILTTRNQDIAQAFAGNEQVISVPVLDDDISFQLLQKLAPKACTANPEAAQQLVNTVGGLPLTLELLGGYLAPSQHSRYDELGTETLSQMLNPQERLQLATHRLGSINSLKVSLQAAIMLSLEDESLPKLAVSTFYALGAFAPKPAYFDRAAAETVAETNLATLAILGSRNLLDDLQGLEHLALHQELANVASTQTSPEAIQRHRIYYLDLVNENREDWRRIESVYSQIKLAWTRQISSLHEDERILDFIWALRIYQERRGLWDDSLTWMEHGLKLARSQKKRKTVATLLNSIGSVYRNLGQIEQAINYFQQAIDIAREIGDRTGEENYLGNLGKIFVDSNLLIAAIDCFQQALNIAREVDDHKGEGNHLSSLGNVYYSFGDLDQALIYYQQALGIAKEVCGRKDEGTCLGYLGRLYIDRGPVNWGIEFCQQALDIAREVGDRKGEGNHLGNLGNAYRKLGQARKAIWQYQRALDIAREVGDRKGEGEDLGNLGSVYADLGQVEQARYMWQESLRIFEEIQSPNVEIIRNQLESLDG